MRFPRHAAILGKLPDPELAAITESEHTPWARYLDDISSELLRLSIACALRLRHPGVVELILENDETVCGSTNPMGFKKLQHL